MGCLALCGKRSKLVWSRKDAVTESRPGQQAKEPNNVTEEISNEQLQHDRTPNHDTVQIVENRITMGHCINPPTGITAGVSLQNSFSSLSDALQWHQ